MSVVQGSATGIGIVLFVCGAWFLFLLVRELVEDVRSARAVKRLHR